MTLTIIQSESSAILKMLEN